MEFSDFGVAVDDGSKVVLDERVEELRDVEDDEVGMDTVVDSVVVTFSSQQAVVISIRMTKLIMSCILIKDNIVLPEILKNNIEL